MKMISQFVIGSITDNSNTKLYEEQEFPGTEEKNTKMDKTCSLRIFFPFHI